MSAPQLHFEEEGHRYWLEVAGSEVDLTSVTQVISTLNLDDTSWFSEAHARAGTRRHSIVEAHSLGDTYAVELMLADDPKLEHALKAYSAFVAETGFEVEHVEVGVFDQGDAYRCGVAGRIDAIGTSWSGRCLVDIKGTSKLRGYPLQVNAYAALWELQAGERIDEVMCLHLNEPAKGKYRLRRHEKGGIFLQAFEAARVLVRWRAKEIVFGREVAHALRTIAKLEEHYG